MQQTQKTLSALLAAATTFALISTTLISTACSSQKKWSEQERKEVHTMLNEWREMVYLNDLAEEEFALFAGNVTDLLEERYPSYVEFIEMPMVGDSVEMVVVATIVHEIKASPLKIRHLFPYHTLVESGVLPKGLSMRHQHDYYKCVADKVNNIYSSMQQFVWGVIYSSLDDEIVAGILAECAEPYWDIDLDVVVVD